jgi:hypothetical protein
MLLILAIPYAYIGTFGWRKNEKSKIHKSFVSPAAYYSFIFSHGL